MKSKETSRDYIGDKKVTISGTKRIAMKSKIEGREYQIFISKPMDEPPPSGYPIIYVLDANSVFGTIVEAVRLQSKRSEKTGVIPAVIVGIGYSTDAPFSSNRYYDFTMASSPEKLPERPNGKPWPPHGGADNFLNFIEKELKPEVQRYIDIDRKRQTLFGHSLGGLFVLNTLFTNPTLFQTYIAGSPSIHWDKELFLEKEEEFYEKVGNENIKANVFIGVGELEREHKSGMNSNALEVSKRLSLLKECGVCVKFKEFNDEGHLSVLLPLINITLKYALYPN